MLAEVDPNPWLQVFGRFHIVLLHLPIGLIPGMMLLEFGAGLLRKPAPRGALLTLAVLTAVVCALAFASGWVLGAEPRPPAKDALIGRHKNFAIAMSLICLLLPFMAALRSRRPFRLGLAAAMALSVVTGHLGGEAVHKSNFLFKPLERARQATEAPAALDTNDASPPVTAASRYAQEIAPIMERCCTSCHNPKDFEGDLDLSTRAALMEGWGAGEVIVVAGEPDASILIESCELPLDDEMHMPPEDEEQLKPAEVAALRKWIADGCPE